MTISAFHKGRWEFLASDLQFLVTHYPIHTSLKSCQFPLPSSKPIYTACAGEQLERTSLTSVIPAHKTGEGSLL